MISISNVLHRVVRRCWCSHAPEFCYRRSISSLSLYDVFTRTLKPTRDHFPWTYSRCLQFYSTMKHLILSDLTQGIDVEALKEKCRRHLIMTGTDLDACSLLQEQLKTKYNQVIENFSEQDRRILKIIQLEHSFLYSQGYAIPSPDEMTSENWLQVLTIGTMEDRFLYYVNLEDIKKWQVSLDSTRKAKLETDERACDCQNSIFYDSENPELETRWSNYRLASAVQFGIPLVIDMDFVDINSATELAPLSQQLYDMYCVNRALLEPFHLLFTSCADSNPIYRHLMLHQMIKTPFVLATFTEKSYLDLFPKHDLIYLSAQSKDIMGEFNCNAVYIIGAYYDPLVRKKGSFIRARELNLKCLRLPISENVRWRKHASKDLDMNHIVGVLSSVKAKQSWKDALFSNVPMLVNQT